MAWACLAHKDDATVEGTGCTQSFNMRGIAAKTMEQSIPFRVVRGPRTDIPAPQCVQPQVARLSTLADGLNSHLDVQIGEALRRQFNPRSRHVQALVVVDIVLVPDLYNHHQLAIV
jgi:hypothetical protein